MQLSIETSDYSLVFLYREVNRQISQKKIVFFFLTEDECTVGI